MAVLPPDVFGPILLYIVKNEGERALLNLRHVSKAWNAAVKEAFRGCVRVSAHEIARSAFEDMQKAVPNLSRLKIYSETQCDLRPVLGFSGLSSLMLSNEKRESWSTPKNFNLDLEVLPASLLNLETHRYDLEAARFKQVSCSGLSALAINDMQKQPAQICQMLEILPALKVISFAWHEDWRGLQSTRQFKRACISMKPFLLLHM